MKRQYELRIMPIDYWDRHPLNIFAEDDGEIKTMRFDTVRDAFEYIGGKLKRERCGWAGSDNNYEYCLMRVR